MKTVINKLNFLNITLLLIVIIVCIIFQSNLLKISAIENKFFPNQLEDYQKYLNSLPKGDINSISLALQKLQSLKLKDKNTNDKLFELYYDFYYQVIYRNDEYNTYSKYSKAILKKNGVIRLGSEAGDYIAADFGFIKTNFDPLVTSGVKEFIKINYNQLKKRYWGYLIEDALLVVTWNELSDWIVQWENYIKQYPQYSFEVNKAQIFLRGDLILYTQSLDMNTFDYMNGKTDENELYDSYQRFIQVYPKSKYQPIIKGYINLLQENGFEYDELAKKYLKSKGIEVYEMNQ